MLSDGFIKCLSTIAEPFTDKISYLYHGVDENSPSFKPAKMPERVMSVLAIQKHGPITERYKCVINGYKNILEYDSSRVCNKRHTRKKIPYGAVLLSPDRTLFYGFVLDEIEPGCYEIAPVVV
ncbi:hypothetical protein MCP_2160 [Methanocella paludicola SANAE]|uniref:Uncharacterized protein n=2 Tax=Methanocella TaxID=570266 RepID=D1Z0L0_METPS|nr:hypothetical protein MCP_2160 [Methanocella paludicola SANAE]